MYIPLVDSLRCPNPHEDTWLVASIESAEERDIKTGFLGCPSCFAEYPIRDDVVYFDEAAVRPPAIAPDEAEATRIAAVLDLTDARMVALLFGACGAHAPLIRAMSPAQLLLVNPPEGVTSGDGVSILVTSAVPIAAAAVDAVAIEAATRDDIVARAIVTLRGGRRMLGPASRAVPAPLEELARDSNGWVARLPAAEVTSAPVLPTRRPRTENR
jgi:uncharacterized protein YbaR (Trm112 family)